MRKARIKWQGRIEDGRKGSAIGTECTVLHGVASRRMIRGVSSVIDYRLEALELLLPRTLGLRNSTQTQGENAPLEAGSGQFGLEAKIGWQLSKAVSRDKFRGALRSSRKRTRE